MRPTPLIFFPRWLFAASCVVTATVCSGGVVVPEILLGPCCSVVHVRTSSSSRGVFVVILLLTSDPDKLGCSAPSSSALSSLITVRHTDYAVSIRKTAPHGYGNRQVIAPPSSSCHGNSERKLVIPAQTAVCNADVDVDCCVKVLKAPCRK